MSKLNAWTQARLAAFFITAGEKSVAAGRQTVAAGSDELHSEHGAGALETPPLVFHLVYSSATGELSQRVLTLRKVEPRPPDVVIGGWCHLRHAYRQFWCSRIREVFDMATGEVHSDAAEFFLSHPFIGTTVAAEDVAIKACRRDLAVLLMVAGADGHVDPSEVDEIVKHVFNRCPDLDLDEGELRRKLGYIAPDEEAFHRALEWLPRHDPVAIQPLLRTVRHVIDADGILDEHEIEVCVEIEAALHPKTGGA